MRPKTKEPEQLFYDIFKGTWRSVKYYEKYQRKLKQIEGIWQHFNDREPIKIKSLSNDDNLKYI